MATIMTVDPYGEAAFPYCVVPNEVLNVFEEHDMNVRDFQRNGSVLYFEVNGHTDAGGDMMHVLGLNDNELESIPAWRKAFYQEIEHFDPWEEAFKWCDGFGIPQNCPFDNGADLYEDLKNYRDDVMQTVYDELMDL